MSYSRALAAAMLSLLLLGCNSESEIREAPPDQLPGSRAFTSDFIIKLDADRAARIRTAGRYVTIADPLVAEAGHTDIFTKVTGTVTLENLSRDRQINRSDLDFVMALMVKAEACAKDDNYTKDLLPGPYCQEELFRLVPGRLTQLTMKPGSSSTESIAKLANVNEKIDDNIAVNKFGSVKAADAAEVVPAVNAGVLVATRRLPADDDTLLPICKDAKGTVWVNLWSESTDVNACSNNPR